MAKVFCALLFLALAISQGNSEGPCNDGKIRGVNLGGWFLLEPWITPSIFDEVNPQYNNQVVDEYTYAQYVDPTFAAERLDRHWNEFYEYQDLLDLYNSGISHVRIPIPYWLVDVTPDEPFPPPPASDYEGMRFYLKRALSWCDAIGLKVLIDLHGAPGSQNGFDNSGRRGDINWVTEGNRVNVDRTLYALSQITSLMSSWIADGTISSETFFGLAILNEPWGFTQVVKDEVLNRFNYEAYDIFRGRFIIPEEQQVMIQQAFLDPYEYVGYMSPSQGYENVGLDIHYYHAFGGYYNNLAGTDEAFSANLEETCSYEPTIAAMTLPTVVGEWSLAITNCQNYLDGGIGFPYNPPDYPAEDCQNTYNSDFSTYSDEYKQFLRDFMRAQMDVYEVGAGYFFWTAKTENNCAPEWDYLFLLKNGIAPADLCTRSTYCY